MKDQYIFEEIKQRYEKSNKYMIFLLAKQRLRQKNR